MRTFLILFFCHSLCVFVKAKTNTQKSVRQWIQIEKLISQEKENWRAQNHLLKAQIDLYKNEVSRLQSQIENTGGFPEEISKKLKLLQNQQDALITEQKRKEISIERETSRLLRLNKKLPQMLQKKLKKDFIELKGSKITQKVEAAVNILRAIETFNKTDTLSNEVVRINGEYRQIEVLYIGLGRAYFMSGEEVGVGTPTDSGWNWKIEEGYHKKIAQLLEEKKNVSGRVVKIPIIIK